MTEAPALTPSSRLMGLTYFLGLRDDVANALVGFWAVLYLADCRLYL